MNDRDREKFYSSTPDDDDDDSGEYELEPPDAHVVASEERRGQEAIEATRASIDIDAIYSDADRERGGEIMEGWIRGFRSGFRFQVKHLLIATAVLAIVLTLAKLDMLGTAVIVGVMLSVAGLFLYLQWQETKQQDEADRRRQALYAQRRAKFARAAGGGSPEADEAPLMQEPISITPLPSEVDEIYEKSLKAQRFQFRFSMFELMAAMTVAAIVFGLTQFLGPSSAATLLGLLALLGLGVHAVGFEPPGMVVLGWWMILVLYVLMSMAAMFWSGIT